MLSKIRQNKFYFFLLRAFALYGFCYFLYEFIIKKHTPLDQIFIRKIINVSSWALEMLGYKTFASKDINDLQVMGIDGSNGVWIGGPCNGITLMFLFAIFVISYPGSVKHKLWYVPVGILAVHTLNIVRIVSLAIIALKKPDALDFNHTYTFTFIAYSFVFMLWMIWVNKFAEPTQKQ